MLVKSKKNQISNEWFFGGNDKVIYNNANMSSSVYDKLDNYGKIRVAFRALDNVKYKRDYNSANEIKIKIFELVDKEGILVHEGNVTRYKQDLGELIWEGQMAHKRHYIFSKCQAKLFGENVKPFKELKDISNAVVKGDHAWLLNYANSLYKVWSSDMKQVLSTNPTAQGVSEVFYKHLSPFIVMDFIFDGFYWRMGEALESIKSRNFDFVIEPMKYIDFIVGMIPRFVFEPREYLKLVNQK